MNVAIIPARGGSKRIPRKNIKLFHGKPIIAYSIETAMESGCFDRIIVSTDDDEIAAVAREFGAEVPFKRPAELSDDFATTLDVMAHATNWLLADPPDIKNVCCIYPTAPLILAEDLRQGLEKLNGSNALNYVFSAVEYTFPVQRAITLQSEKVSMLMPEFEQTRSQDLPKTYHDAGQFYWGKASAFTNKTPIFTGDASIVALPQTRVQDIDTLENWLFAESLYQHYVTPHANRHTS